MVLIQMHTGGGALFSRVIRWFSRSDYSHVSLWFYDATHPQGGYVIEAIEGKGVRVLPAEYYREARRSGRIRLYAHRDTLTPAQVERMWTAVSAERGKGYDWLGVVRFVTRRRKNGAADKWFCSELAAYGFEQAEAPLFRDKPSWQVMPGDIPQSLAVVPCDDPEAV